MNVVSKLNKTTWFIIVTALVWLVYDIIAFVTGKLPTISDEITRWAYYTPAIPLVVGILLGHWFWTTNVKR